MKWEETRVMQYLHDIYNSVLLKDVIARNKIRDTALLESVIAYLMDNIGNTFSAKTITDFLKNQGRKLSAETVYNICELWRALFSFIKRCALTSKGNVFWKRRRSIISLTLVCAMQLSDTVTTILLGFWKALCIWSFFAVAGRFISESKMWQKWILSRSDRRATLHSGVLCTHPENTEREFGPLEGISDNYEKLVLSTDTLLRINRGGIRQKNIVDFLLET